MPMKHKMDATLKDLKAGQRLKEETRAGQELLKGERMMARMDSRLEKMEAYLEKKQGHGFGDKSGRNRV
jgi:hypothetical protein